MLVRFECGCIGLPPRDPGPEAKAILITCCDDDYDRERPTQFWYRDYMGAKSFEPLDPVKEERLVESVQGLINQGYTLRDTQDSIRSVLTALHPEDG